MRGRPSRREHARDLDRAKTGGAAERDQRQPFQHARIEQTAQAPPADRGDATPLLPQRSAEAGTPERLATSVMSNPVSQARMFQIRHFSGHFAPCPQVNLNGRLRLSILQHKDKGGGQGRHAETKDEQARVWNGSRRQRVEAQEFLDQMFSDLKICHADGAAASARRVLDVGCGRQHTLAAARRLGRGRSVGIDISNPMISGPYLAGGKRAGRFIVARRAQPIRSSVRALT